MSSKVVDSEAISKISEKEKELAGEPGLVEGGPTVKAQSHAGESLTGSVISDITQGEKKVSDGDRVSGGPTATAQSIATTSGASKNAGTNTPATGVLDSRTISKVTAAEKELTGSDDPVRQGPTAKAQQHAGETINSQTLHDVTEGEKNVTGGERLKGGPTSILQSEVAKSQQ